jgi:hypothetical protein
MNYFNMLLNLKRLSCAEGIFKSAIGRHQSIRMAL